jgi:hypothetical protein
MHSKPQSETKRIGKLERRKSLAMDRQLVRTKKELKTFIKILLLGF